MPPITITDCHVEAEGGPGASAIGFGYSKAADASSHHQIRGITITNSTIKATVHQDENGVWPAHILGSARSMGLYLSPLIRIVPPEGMKAQEFFKEFNNSGNPEDAVVGYPKKATPDWNEGSSRLSIQWDRKYTFDSMMNWSDIGRLN